MPEPLTPARHEELRERLVDLVVPGMAPSERAELEEHVAACSACRDRLGRLQRAHGLLAATEPSGQPSQALDDRVAQIPVRAQPAPRARPSVRRRSLALASVAALALVIAGGFVIGDPRGGSTPQPTASTAPEFASSTVLVPTRSDVAVAVAMAAGKGADLPMKVTASGLTPGEEYSLWLTGEQGEVLVETFRPDKVGDCSVVVTAPAGDWSGAIVRWEGPSGEDVIAAAPI